MTLINFIEIVFDRSSPSSIYMQFSRTFKNISLSLLSKKKSKLVFKNKNLLKPCKFIKLGDIHKRTGTKEIQAI